MNPFVNLPLIQKMMGIYKGMIEQNLQPYMHKWIRSWSWGYLVTWFCYQLIAKPGNNIATPPWPEPYIYTYICVCVYLLADLPLTSKTKMATVTLGNKLKINWFNRTSVFWPVLLYIYQIIIICRYFIFCWWKISLNYSGCNRWLYPWYKIKPGWYWES